MSPPSSPAIDKQTVKALSPERFGHANVSGSVLASRKTSNGQCTARHGAAAPRDRTPAEKAERIADRVLVEPEQNRRRAGASKVGDVRPAHAEPYHHA